MSSWDLEYFFSRFFTPKIKSVQNGLNAKKHKKNFSFEQLLPQTGPECDGLGQEYLDNLSPGRPLSGLGRYSSDQSGFEAFSYEFKSKQIFFQKC